MKKLIPVCLSLFAMVLIQACGDNQRAKNYNGKTQVDQDGLDFIMRANESGLTEIKASGLAVTMSKNPRVISLAKMMITDHTQVGKELATLAADKFVDKPDTLSLGHKRKIDSLAHMKTGFDKAYVNMMLNDHMDAINLFNNGALNRINAVQQFAKKTLPSLRMHLDSVKAVAASLK